MSRSLSVLQVLPELNLGGVERGTLELAQALVDHGHRSYVMSAGGRMVQKLLKEGSTHIELSVGRKSLATLGLLGTIRHHLHTESFDIVHVRSRFPAWIMRLALRKINPRPLLFSTVHAPYRVNYYSRIMARADRVIAVSDFIRDYIVNNYPDTDPQCIHVIHNGVCPEQFPRGYQPESEWLQRWQRDWPMFSGKRLITLPARITRSKGHEDFIAIMRQLIKVFPHTHGVIVGDAHPHQKKFLESLQEYICQQKLEKHITFVGHHSDIRDVLSISSVVLSLAKKPEAFGRVSLEALSLGTPVVAYNHGGSREVLSRILPEGLVTRDDTAAVVNCIMRFLESPPTILDNSDFILSNVMKKTLALYTDSVAS